MSLIGKASRRWVLILLAIALLAACQRYQQTQLTDQIEITTADDGCAPLDARVEAGSTVTVRIENRSKATQVVRVLIYPQAIESDPERPENLYWQARVRPGFTVIEELKAPEMPGDYDFICGKVDSRERSQGDLTVVRR